MRFPLSGRIVPDRIEQVFSFGYSKKASSGKMEMFYATRLGFFLRESMFSISTVMPPNMICA